MAFSEKSLTRVAADCKRIRNSWSDAERARRRKLGEARGPKLVQLLKSINEQQAA